MSFDAKQRIVAALQAHSNEVPEGRYEFAIYQWRFHGIKEDLVLRPIGSSETITKHLSQLLEKALDFATNDPQDGTAPVWDELDTQHYNLWAKARTDHRQRTQELAAYRRESLTTSHRARIALLEEQHNQTNDQKIQKMRLSQIAAAEADYTRRIQDLDIAMERADLTAQPVAYGVIKIIGDTIHAEQL
jgi:ATP-dependent helicase HepA